MEEIDRGDEYARQVTIDGEACYEVAVRDKDNDGYLVEYVNYNRDTSLDEIEEQVEDTLEELREEADRPNEGNWREEFPERVH